MFLTRENYHEFLSNKGNILRGKLYEYEISEFSELPNISKIEVIYLFKNNMLGRPKCQNEGCENECSFAGTTVGFRECCSKSCSRNNTLKPVKEIKLKDIDDCYSESGKLRWKYIKQFNIPKDLNWCRDIIEVIYCLKNNILSIPQCPECGNILNFLGINKGYRTYCSTTCSNNSEIVKDNKVRVLMERYGVENSSQVHLGPKDPLDFNPRKYKTSGYLYIMKSNNLNKFKIGVSVNPTKRYNYIKGESGISDLELIEFIHLDYVYMYENFLHRKYNDYRSPISQGDGKTEWFFVECYNEVLRELKQIGSTPIP